MKISIIIPTYKPRHYIEECLDSTQNQSFSKEDFEVIIVLNGAIQPYLNYINKLVEKYDFMITLLTTEQGGVSNARNLAMTKSSGEYICFIDDDDIISPTYLEALYAKASENTIAVSNVKAFIDETHDFTEDYISKAFTRMKAKDVPLTVLEGRKFMSSSCCKMISRKAIGHITFDTDLTIGEDSVFMSRISKNIKTILLADESAIYYRRVRDTSASRTTRSFTTKVHIVTRLLSKYAGMLTPSYNLPFIGTRILATFLKLHKT